MRLEDKRGLVQQKPKKYLNETLFSKRTFNDIKLSSYQVHKLELEDSEISMQWKSNQFIRDTLFSKKLSDAINLTLHTRTHDHIKFEMDVKHLYNKVSYRINKNFRREPVFALYVFLHKVRSGKDAKKNFFLWHGVHGHAIVRPPRKELITKQEFIDLLKDSWISTHNGLPIHYALPVNNWEGSVAYDSNPLKDIPEKNLQEHFYFHGHAYWE